VFLVSSVELCVNKNGITAVRRVAWRVRMTTRLFNFYQRNCLLCLVCAIALGNGEWVGGGDSGGEEFDCAEVA
jgi:hypothetical protein